MGRRQLRYCIVLLLLGSVLMITQMTSVFDARDGGFGAAFVEEEKSSRPVSEITKDPIGFDAEAVLPAIDAKAICNNERTAERIRACLRTLKSGKPWVAEAWYGTDAIRTIHGRSNKMILEFVRGNMRDGCIYLPPFVGNLYHVDPAPNSPKTTTMRVVYKHHEYLLRADERQGFNWCSPGRSYVHAAWDALMRARNHTNPNEVMPLMAIPLFHDGDELVRLLLSLTGPVREFVFIQNGNDWVVSQVLRPLKKLPFGVTFIHSPHNLGFAGAANEAIREMMRRPNVHYVFFCNADVTFVPGSIEQFSRIAEEAWETDGLIYGPALSNFAFAISRRAAERVGLWDEVFYPAYMEDIDYHWRVRLGGLGERITHAQFVHQGNANLGLNKEDGVWYREALERHSMGWEYALIKWGLYTQGDIRRLLPPSGYTRPFNLSVPLGFWVLDPQHRRCIDTGEGPFYAPFPKSLGTSPRMHSRFQRCYYNASVLLPHLPPGNTLPAYLLTNYSSCTEAHQMRGVMKECLKLRGAR